MMPQGMEYPHAAVFLVFVCICMGFMIQTRWLFRLGRIASLGVHFFIALVASVIMPDADGTVVHEQAHKAKPQQPPASLSTQFDQ